MNLQEWLEQKFIEWERAQGTRQSYYNFARYLDVNHTALTQWLSGIALPDTDDQAKIADKLGSEIYALPGLSSTSPAPTLHLPTALRARLDGAMNETSQAISQRQLNAESDEAKRLALKIFEKWGFRITG